MYIQYVPATCESYCKCPTHSDGWPAQLEVAPKYMAEVEAIKPRLVDVLNGYLRAVALSELEDPTALIRLRAQMLRRLQVVAGEGRITDLLIMEFVLS